MLKNILTVLRKLASAAMNFLIVYFETIAVPMSWAMGGTIMFTMYTELSNIFNGAVCLLVGLWQLGCIFTGRELPLWLKRLKFISTSCLAMTFLTVVIILAPMYEDGNGWYIMLFTGSMLYHHFLNPVLAILSLVLFERLPRLPLRQVDAIIHRQSIVHSLVEYRDGAMLAQLGTPDMKLPIRYAMTYPHRAESPDKPLDLLTCGALTFAEPDERAFPCLRLARYAAAVGGTACAILNGANEAAVGMFLRGEIGFNDISRRVERALERVSVQYQPSLADILEADKAARHAAL